MYMVRLYIIPCVSYCQMISLDSNHVITVMIIQFVTSTVTYTQIWAS